MKPVRSGWKRCLIAPLILIASLVMWIEESLWNGLKWLMAILARLTWIGYLESLIQRLSPAATVVAATTCALARTCLRASSSLHCPGARFSLGR